MGKAKKSSEYLIGIDLGTTNCTLAYSALSDEKITQFSIPQITAANMQGEHHSLPSFLYFPLDEELKNHTAAISWDPKRSFCIGIFAQSRGAELPHRLVSSAKSWLCHSGINRREALLPISAESDKISPLDACSQLLVHLREAWDAANESPFVDQKVFITVPASFDPSARQLVQEAAEKAGYPESVLLEEPQAAFYAWIQAHENEWRRLLNVGDIVLVVDIGGGTTDFSLIEVGEENGELSLKRLAVGAHLLLGGDNIDFSLAYFAQQKFEEQGHSLSDWQFQSLVHSCRTAKEQLLGENPPATVDLTIMGRGSKLIGGSITIALSYDEVIAFILEGFVPLVSPQQRSQIERRAGLQQVGLPYAQDPCFSRQLAKFLSLTGERDSDSMETFVVPSAVLFNGGTMKASALRQRLIEQLNRWAKELGKSEVKELPGADYDFAVGRGAVSYGKACNGKGIRIRSGTSRSYYIGVEDAVPAVPGLPTPLKAVCIAPFGMEEGSEEQLDSQEFALTVGQQALFRFFSHSTPTLPDGSEPTIGTVVKQWKSDLMELHPIETVLDKAEDDGKTIHVKIDTKVTELGMLEVWCVAADGRKWKLEFDIREE